MATFRILITGSREYADLGHARATIAWALSNVRTQLGWEVPAEQVVVVHGGARGADRILGAAAQEAGCTIEVHRADWENNGRAAGFIRNAHMVSLGANIVLAFPVGASRGTRHCIKTAQEAGLRVINVTGQ